MCCRWLLEHKYTVSPLLSDESTLEARATVQNCDNPNGSVTVSNAMLKWIGCLANNKLHTQVKFDSRNSDGKR